MMCGVLREAKAGSEAHAAAFGVAWIRLLQDGIGMVALGRADPLGYANCLYGKGRVMETLNKHGSVRPLADKADLVALVREALAGPEPIGVELELDARR
jgi:hypothetical protein